MDKDLLSWDKTHSTIEAITSAARSTLQKAHDPNGERKDCNAGSLGNKLKVEMEADGEALKDPK